MTKLTVLGAAFAALIAAPAAAQSVSSGEAQLARILGVQPGVYSLSQLTQLSDLRGESGVAAQQSAAFILDNPRGPGVATAEVTSAGNLPLFTAATGGAGLSSGATQLARLVGVEPGLYSLDQLARLNDLKGDSSTTAQQTVRFILDNPKGPRAGS
jgi:hypothetical protein